MFGEFRPAHNGSDVMCGVSWPDDEVFVDINVSSQFLLGLSRCVRVAVCDDSGAFCRKFVQGQRLHIYSEFEVHEQRCILLPGCEIVRDDGFVLHGATSLEKGGEGLSVRTSPCVIRVHQWFLISCSPGHYSLNVGLATTEPEAYSLYTNGSMPFEKFQVFASELVRCLRAVSFTVLGPESRRLLFHGAVDLAGGIQAEEIARSPAQNTAVAHPVRLDGQAFPTVFHVTHWKAGSQWIYRILQKCFPDRIVSPAVGEAQVRHYPIRRGGVYPTVYLANDEYAKLRLPEDSKRFVIIRDLRDTLVSAYFSFKISHPVLDDSFAVLRSRLVELDTDGGLLLLMDEFLPHCARIQLSWLESGEPILRYEDLLQRDVELLEDTLIRTCGLPLDPASLKRHVEDARFTSLTNGRAPGVEDLAAHERKGVAGDWPNHFSDRVKEAFKARFGGLLALSGYERDLSW